MKRFQNRNVLVSGAASGIGRAASLRMAAEGASLALMDLNEEGLCKTAKEAEGLGAKVVFAKCNVADFEAVGKTIDHLAEELGGIQAVSHNAGIMRCYNTHEMSIDEWNELISINLTGTFNVNRHALKHLLKNEYSYLVNTASNAASYRHPWLAAYAATKGAIKSFTRSLFIEYCLQGLRANCVLPGSVETPLARSFTIPKGANPDLLKTLAPLRSDNLLTPDHIAATIAFLASDDAAHINGTEITVDGGKI